MPVETPEKRAKRRADEILRIKRELGAEAAQKALAKLMLDILNGRA